MGRRRPSFSLLIVDLDDFKAFNDRAAATKRATLLLTDIARPLRAGMPRLRRGLPLRRRRVRAHPAGHRGCGRARGAARIGRAVRSSARPGAAAGDHLLRRRRGVPQRTPRTGGGLLLAADRACYVAKEAAATLPRPPPMPPTRTSTRNSRYSATPGRPSPWVPARPECSMRAAKRAVLWHAGRTRTSRDRGARHIALERPPIRRRTLPQGHLRALSRTGPRLLAVDGPGSRIPGSNPGACRPHGGRQRRASDDDLRVLTQPQVHRG